MLNRHTFRQENYTARGSTETQSTGVTHARPPRPPKARAGIISLCNPSPRYNLFAGSAKKVCTSIAGAAGGPPPCTITRPVANPRLRQGVPSGGRNRSLRVIAPIPVIMDKLRTFGLIITAKCRPAPARNLTNVPDSSIVKWYTALAHGILSYYRCCDNFHKLRSIVDYHVRWSAIFTLATKHKSSASKVIYKYSRDLIIPVYAGDYKRDTIARFPAK